MAAKKKATGASNAELTALMVAVTRVLERVTVLIDKAIEKIDAEEK